MAIGLAFCPTASHGTWQSSLGFDFLFTYAWQTGNKHRKAVNSINRHIENDCDKMKEMSKEANANPDKFFVFFQSSHEKEDLDNITRHSNLIAYVNYIKRGLNARGDIKTQWEDLFGDYGDLSENIKFEAGEYYGVKIHINTLILKVKP